MLNTQIKEMAMTVRINCGCCGCDFDAPGSVTITGVCGSNDLICDECAMDLRDGGMDDDDYDYDTDREDFHLADDMDGDHESALASAGWGTDEDYYYDDYSPEYYDDGWNDY